MTFQFSIACLKKISTLLDERIHIMSQVCHNFHDHQNKMMPLVKPSSRNLLLCTDLNDDTKFCNYSC
jgi:hypothetical protein